jgi:hypothetical protein
LDEERKTMTLREQIISIHAKHFSPEFHEYRQGLTPAMVNDLAMKFFDSMEKSATMANVWHDGALLKFYYLPDNQDLRAVIKARELVNTLGLHADIPGVE